MEYEEKSLAWRFEGGWNLEGWRSKLLGHDKIHDGASRVGLSGFWGAEATSTQKP